MALLGKSGSGKLTLLNLRGGLDRPTAGSRSLQVGGHDLAAMGSRQLIDVGNSPARHVD